MLTTRQKADKLARVDFMDFVGAWTLQWTGYRADGSSTDTASGSLTFESILGGRAVRDEWHVAEAVPPFHGTTVRFLDADLDAWRSTWIEPINGRIRQFVGRTCGSDFVLISIDEQPLLRWSFTEVTADSFVWVGENSLDEGRTWRCEEVMHARRLRTAL